ncbi:Transcriptional regulator, IclR family [Halanaerobium saccharolyticum subsp. saccharolyticum DSM 6643]|uniref:Transcriptional regulator, IclR family n=1 Tax=Halanaerobium saccharolyticum subsp. saccharolyticum DSM 6643 TaxID=1293054 RepID=M5ECU6_9FIRM|nr:IclR family transcriptional regulator [Halanaerobium saccharolyticum]CCU78707.1 Transcriptional regulator, IclR family [Halanaerobium saccharolyticum subsp. saccharolyticum DSM 6643]
MVRLNKSALRVTEILSLISKSQESLTISEVSTTLDIPKSSTFNLLYTLVEKDFLEIDDDKLKTFKLGLKSFEVGTSYLQDRKVSQVAVPLVEKLMSEVKNTVFLAVEDKNELVYLNKSEPLNEVRTTAKLGSRMPMYCTGLGKAILATYSNEHIKTKFSNENLKAVTKYTITNINDLIKDLEMIRSRGYSIDNRESEEKLFCLAAPIYDFSEKAIATISIATLYSEITEDKIEEYSRKVRETALNISRKLGFMKKDLYF